MSVAPWISLQLSPAALHRSQANANVRGWSPAQSPRFACSRLPIVLGGGALVATVLAVIAAALADLRSGRILETWQVQRTLGLAVLGELPRP